jgi:1-aminocyclopropane-1-carboxylate deaminase/D-cysteine desulfhydrase-like pyridoxal-dependent ACC family enzyme
LAHAGYDAPVSRFDVWSGDPHVSHPILSAEELRRCVARLPRLPLAHLPTPLEEAPRFRARTGGPRLFLKRDDCTGLLFGGNKTRHNEFLLADAQRKGCDLIVWGAGVQSNNCRQTAAACARLGLDCHLVLTRAAHDDDIQGNLLLDHLVGATVEIVDVPMGPEVENLLLARAEEFRAAGRRPYVWDRVHGRPIAAVSYALCLAEIAEQMQAVNREATAIYCSAAGATGAGLIIGKAVLGLKCQIRLVAPIRWPWDMAEDLAEVANQTAALLGLPHRVNAADVEIRTDFIGPGYGQLTPEGWEAMDLLARSEGVLLDPVYTGKAMAGLIADIRKRRVTTDDVVVFIHTGGVPAVFAYRDELLEYVKKRGR